MKTIKYLTIVLTGIFVFAACKKEYSYESGVNAGPSSGTLLDSAGQCQSIAVYGNYLKDSVLTDSNYVVVKVNFSVPGKYKIFSDTQNGFSFQDSGYTVNTGLQSIKVKATGKPIISKETIFQIAYDTTFCSFSVVVTDTPVTQPPVVTPPVATGDYFPTTTNSNWSYRSASSTDTNLVIVDANDITVGTNTYRTFISNGTAGTDSFFYRKGGGLYYEYSDLNQFSLFDTVLSKVDYIFLKDKAAVSDNWESPEVDATLGSLPGKAKIRFTIIAKDVTTTLGTQQVDSVMQIQREYMFAPTATGSYQTAAIVNFYYAKNIGFVKAEATSPVALTVYANRWQVF